MSKDSLKPLHGPAVLFLLLLLAYWRILLTDQYTWLNGSDLANQVLPWLQFQAGEWHAGRIPLWSPYEWGGQNLLGQGQPGVMNPLNWLLFAMPLRRGWLRQGVLHWWFFALHYVAALNLYWLARSLGATKAGALLGGLAFALFGFLGSNDWPQMISGLIWAPLVFLFLLKSARGERGIESAAWAGLFLGLSWLSGHHQLPIFVSLAVAGASIALRIYPALLTFAVAGLVGAAQLLPGLAYGRTARRWVGMENTVGWKDNVAYFVHDQYASAPTSLFGIVLPGLENHTSFFLGMTALVLALWAIRSDWARREVKLFLGIGIAALLYAMGRNGLIESLFYAIVPMIEKARSPSMAASLFTLGFAVLAALGFTRLPTALHSRLPSRLHWGFSAAVLLLFFLGMLGQRSQQRLEDRWIAVAFVSGLLGFAYFAWQRGELSLAWLQRFLVAAVLIESANMTYYNMGNLLDNNTPNMLTPMSRHTDVPDFLASRPGPIRITLDDKAIPYNFGDWQGVEVMGGYLASLSANLHDADWFSETSLQLLGINYHVGPTPRKEGSTLVFQGEHGINVWQYPRPAFPRAWFTQGTLAYGSSAEYNNLAAADSLDLRKVALLPRPVAGLESCQPGEAIVLKHLPSEVVLRATAKCRSLLILAETNDEGWSVSVDGKAAANVTADHALRAVAVDKGAHNIVWTYSPPGFRLGLLLSFIGLLIPLGLRIQASWRA